MLRLKIEARFMKTKYLQYKQSVTNRVHLLWTPDTTRKGRNTRKARRALTSTLIYCWKISVSSLKKKIIFDYFHIKIWNIR